MSIAQEAAEESEVFPNVLSVLAFKDFGKDRNLAAVTFPWNQAKAS